MAANFDSVATAFLSALAVGSAIADYTDVAAGFQRCHTKAAPAESAPAESSVQHRGNKKTRRIKIVVMAARQVLVGKK
jgi:hypothetical protein